MRGNIIILDIIHTYKMLREKNTHKNNLVLKLDLLIRRFQDSHLLHSSCGHWGKFACMASLASSYIDYYYLLNYYKIFTFTLMRVKVKKCLFSLFRSFHSHFSFVNLHLFTFRHRWASPATPSHSLLQEKSPLI